MDAKIIREKREELGLTQSELAALIGVSLRTIQNYEKDGVIPSSKYEILRNVLNAGNINISGDGNVANTGSMDGRVTSGSNDEVQKMREEIIKLKGELATKEAENQGLRNELAIRVEMITFLQNKK